MLPDLQILYIYLFTIAENRISFTNPLHLLLYHYRKQNIIHLTLLLSLL